MRQRQNRGHVRGNCKRVQSLPERYGSMTTLQELLDEREITRGLARFARVLDGKQWDQLGDVFSADVAFDYGSGEVQHGIAALREHISLFLDRCGGTQHLVGSI